MTSSIFIKKTKSHHYSLSFPTQAIQTCNQQAMAPNQTSRVLCLGCNQFFTCINMYWSHNEFAHQCTNNKPPSAMNNNKSSSSSRVKCQYTAPASAMICMKMTILLKQACLVPKKATIRTLMEMAFLDHILGSLVVTPPPISLAVPLVTSPTVNLPLHYQKQEACSISKPDLIVAIVLFQCTFQLRTSPTLCPSILGQSLGLNQKRMQRS